jgi:hypothetical protein
VLQRRNHLPDSALAPLNPKIRSECGLPNEGLLDAVQIAHFTDKAATGLSVRNERLCFSQIIVKAKRVYGGIFQ